MAKKINKEIKKLDAAARLVLAGRKKASVIVTQDGLLCSTGLDAVAPSGVALPKGQYRGEQLLEAFDTLKYCADIQVASEQTDAGWGILLYDPADVETRSLLDWQDCADIEIPIPQTVWKVDKEQLKMFKAAYTMAQALVKSQLRLLRLQPAAGVMSYLSPTTVAQWWDPSWVYADAIDPTVDIEIADLKRARLYRGGDIIAIGASDGKVNFAFSDGAFLRVDKYDGHTYDENEIQEVAFTFDETSYAWPLGADQPAQKLLEMITGGSKVSETDGVTFYAELGAMLDSNPDGVGVPMPLQCGAAKFTPKIINQLAQWADTIQPSGVDSPWDSRSIGFYSVGYRSVTSTSFLDIEALERGITTE